MKKKHALEGRDRLLSFTKLLKCMKLVSIFMIAGALSVRAGGFSQDVKVSFTLNNVKLTTFFKVIEKETNYRFIYSNDIIPDGRFVKVTAQKAPVSSVLEEVFAGTHLKYRFDEALGIFIVSEKTPMITVNAAEAARVIRGSVMNEQGEPLPNVSVQVKGSTVATTTNNEGNFTIEVGDNATALIISFVGMETQEVAITGSSSIHVVMKLANQALSEVVVVGYGTQQRTKVTGAISSVSGKTLNELPS
ncbi:MAG: carboxypeptidase-like regulatory domain-containing protein, partial [Chitinophagaceae bacterium]|nr:carboxypeptidase-like regulatory domain-containing protein [Chitinophagaceae bacterium]